MKFSRSDFEMQRFESRRPRLESWRISIPECGGSNPADLGGQALIGNVKSTPGPGRLAETLPAGDPQFSASRDDA
jgi:hypothetical protein